MKTASEWAYARAVRLWKEKRGLHEATGAGMADIAMEFDAIRADAFAAGRRAGLEEAATVCVEIALAHRQRTHGFDVGSPGERVALAASCAADVCAANVRRALQEKPDADGVKP